MDRYEDEHDDLPPATSSAGTVVAFVTLGLLLVSGGVFALDKTLGGIFLAGIACTVGFIGWIIAMVSGNGRVTATLAMACSVGVLVFTPTPRDPEPK